VHPPFLTRVGEKELFSGVGRFEMTILAAREPRPVKRQALPYHFSRKVTTIGEIAPGNGATVIVDIGDFCSHGVAFAKPVQGPFRVLSMRVVQLRRVDPE
jgi:hypothetical protein